MSEGIQDQKLFLRYSEALERFHAHPVKVDVDVATMMSVVANLQLAARHPQNRGLAHEAAKAFVDQAERQLAALDPVFAEVIARGRDPKHDIQAHSE
jgi:hypothetical protein